MKRRVIFAVVIIVLAAAALLVADTTTNLGLTNNFTDGAVSWSASLNTNFNRIEKFLSGTLALPGMLDFTETTAPSAAAGYDFLWADSTSHRFKMANNNGSADTVVGAATTDTYTNKTFDSGGSGNVLKIAGTTLSAGAISEVRAFCTGVVGTAETEYLNFGACSGATSLTASQTMATAGTVANLQVSLSAVCKNSANPCPATVYKNGSSTTLTCNVASNALTCNDATHTVTVAAGDRIAFQFGVTNSTDTAANVSMAIQKY